VCFSATASFSAAIALLGLGAWSIRVAAPRARPLAAVPLLFSMQQASEGLVWLAVNRAPFGVTHAAIVEVFLFFAVFVWPAYLPVALRAAEPRADKRRILGGLAILGVGLGAYLMATVAFKPSGACFAFGNLYYGIGVDAPLKPISPFVYAAVVLIPFVVSSLRGTNALAVAVAVSFAVAGIFYRVGFASVWCFFAAGLSGIVAVVARANRSSSRRSERSSTSELSSGGRAPTWANDTPPASLDPASTQQISR
jgi:hypothetical protein